MGGGVVLAGTLLAWPAPSADVANAPSGARQFVWGRDSVWRELDASFAAARKTGCQSTANGLNFVSAKLLPLRTERVAANDPALDSLEDAFFKLGVQAAACGEMVNDYLAMQGRLRDAIKSQSTTWDLSDRAVRDRLYRALYGSRAAAEEVMLQHRDSVLPLLLGRPVGSQTPAALSNGVELRSGDILVSRGGYPTSALIARGNDYPGNFSHIAFVHVDSATHAISVIEAHIERGVAVGTPEEYLAGKKYRVMLLRLRPELPELRRDPMLPHRAATTMLERARTEHIPYDFTMDYADPSRLFCSEVVSAAYREHGITLWTGLSTISAPGLRNWLSSFGVKQFETQEPSDLEYDPQLSVVAEWRSAASLFDDHLDNAVTDVMLEGAERGEALTFDWYALPVARLLKGYSWLRGTLGGVGSIPEGMSASAALRNRAYNARHARLKAELRSRVEQWHSDNGYLPPYWTLVSLMREATGR